MGLKLTLNKEQNTLHYDFIDAYWAVETITYSTDSVTFDLNAYPTREAKLAYGTTHANPSIGYGGSNPFVNSRIYSWVGQFSISDIFPSGIPLGRDAQLGVLYNFVKAYTGLPFEDVFEN